MKHSIIFKVALAGAILIGCAATAQHTNLNLPFTERFGAANLGPDWSLCLAKGNSVRLHDGMLEMHARSDTRAHIERRLGRDLIRVSGAFNDGEAATPGSLFLKWDNSNFVQLGVNQPAPGRLTAREVLGTYACDYDLGPWPAGRWRMLAIELAKDCIRYLASEDGKDFKCLRVSRRPERVAGAPKLMVIGQDCDGKLFPPPSPFLAPPATLPIGCGQYRDIQVRALEASQLEASPAERRELTRSERDLFGEQELASPEDPSFDSVCRYYPPMKWPREVVGVKDHPFDIGVAADGSLQFTNNIAVYGKRVAFFTVNGYRFGSASCSKKLHKGYLPVVIAADRHEGLEFEETVFGYSQGLSPDEPLVGYVQFRATNLGDVERSCELRLNIEPMFATASGPWRLALAPHSTQTISLCLPYRLPDTPIREVTAQEFGGKLEEVTVCWEKIIAQGSRFEIPEPRVQNAYRAWIAYNFLNVAKRGDVYHTCDGSGFYNEVYGYSAALYCNALDLLGYPEQAVTYCDSLLTFMHTNGLLAVNFGDTDTGVALWSMSEHYRLTRDAEWLRRVAPKMLSMCDWIIAQRYEALAQAANQPKLTKGLIRYRPYADLLHPAADYFSNGYLCRGLAAAAAVLGEIGMKDEAVRLRRESDSFYRDITASMDAAVFKDAGMKILPLIPDSRELWKESNGSANGYYGIIAPCLLEAGIPAWNDPKAALLVEALQRRGGLTAGVCQFHDLVDHAYTYGYWMNRLQHDDVRPAILGLYASMAYGMSRDTYAAVECTAIRRGENYWTLPHTYSNTQQLRLLRNMLLREEGTRLWLGQAVPRAWLAPGKRVAVNDAPTLFGPVSYSFTPGDDGSIWVQLSPPARLAPEEIIIRLRHPVRLKIAKVNIKGTARVTFAGDIIRLKQANQPLEMKVDFR